MILTYVTDPYDPYISDKYNQLKDILSSIDIKSSRLYHLDQSVILEEYDIPSADDNIIANIYELLWDISYYPVVINTTNTIKDIKLIMELCSSILSSIVNNINVIMYEDYISYIPLCDGNLIYRSADVIAEIIRRLHLADIANMLYVTNDMVVQSVDTSLELVYHEGILMAKPTPYPSDIIYRIDDEIINKRMNGYFSVYPIQTPINSILLEELLEVFNINISGAVINNSLIDRDWLDINLHRISKNKWPIYRFTLRDNTVEAKKAFMMVNNIKDLPIAEEIKIHDYVAEIPVKSMKQIIELNDILNNNILPVNPTDIQSTPDWISIYRYSTNRDSILSPVGVSKSMELLRSVGR